MGGNSLVGAAQYSTFSGLRVKEKRVLDFSSPTASLATAGAITYTVAQMMGGMILRNTNGANRADLTPTAALLIAGMQNRLGDLNVGSCFDFELRQTSAGAETITLTAGTGVTISGTATVGQNNQKRFRVVITGPTTVTIYSCGTVVF